MTTETPRRSMQARGFLFADLRGYTAFVETRGDVAAAELLRTYRAVVRDVIGRFDGAEIRTEGDSFYVVFPSASDAVLAGLAILEQAAAASQPVRVGVGVHAGEAAETDEGYVGWAVNIAARVCSSAGPGELFVTDTVRALTRGQVGFRFSPRGRRRLKGVAEPVALYAVNSADAAIEAGTAAARLRGVVAPRLTRRLALPTILALGVLILTAGAIALLGEQLGGTAGEQPTSAPPVAVGSASPAGTDASPTAAADPAAEREAANERLAARVEPNVARLCTDADPDDAPNVVETSALEPTLRPLDTSGGLRCTLGGGAGPDVVYFWEGLLETERLVGEGSRDAFFALAGQRNLPPGDCSEETRAWGEWEFGATRGLLLCSGFGGEALLMWTYEGTAIVAQATREDGDSERLYRWWEDHARLLAPEPSS